MGFWVAPERLDCSTLRALLWCLCFRQVSFVPRADTFLSFQVLLLPAVPRRCKAFTAASPHHMALLVRTLVTLLHVVCFMGYHEAGEDLQHFWFLCRLRRAELRCSAREDESHGVQVKTHAPAHTFPRLHQTWCLYTGKKKREDLYPQSRASSRPKKKKKLSFSSDFHAFHFLPCCSAALTNAICKKEASIESH